MKKFAGDIILHMCNKNHNMWCMVPEIWSEADKLFCYYGPFFALLPNTWRYYNFTHLHHKWQSNDVWFLIYGVQQTDVFVILDNFLPFYPLWTQKIKILEKWTTNLKIISFYKCVPYMTVIWCMVPEIWSATDRIFCHFGPFFALLPP